MCCQTDDIDVSVFGLQLSDDEKYLKVDFGDLTMELHAVDVLALSILGDAARQPFSESHFLMDININVLHVIAFRHDLLGHDVWAGRG